MPKQTRYFVLVLSIVVVNLDAIALTAIYSKFDGVVQIKLGRDGAQVLIDKHSSHQAK